jgi:hypothetical protein
VFPRISLADEETFVESVVPIDVVSRFKSFSEAPRLTRKYGTHRSDSPVRAL